jgi:hypothetical protein
MVVGGAGRIGSYAVDFLARTPGIDKIWIADMNEERGQCLAFNSSTGAAFAGFYPYVHFIKTNVLDEDGVVRVLISTMPDFILNTTTTFSSYLYIPILTEKLKEHGLPLRMPAHAIARDLLPLYCLMKSVKRAGLTSPVVNVCFSDVAHPVLAKVGLYPAVGAGEVASLAQALKMNLCHKMSIHVSKMRVLLIAQHALLVTPPELVPYYATIQVDEHDLTSKISLNKEIREAQRLMLKVPEVGASMTASHAVKLLSAMLNDSNELLLAPGANGMAGCLPVRMNSNGPSIELPRGLSLQEVEALFKKGMNVDGVEKINDDGSIVFSESALRILRDILGIDRKVLRLSELKEMNDELLSSYERMNRKTHQNS